MLTKLHIQNYAIIDEISIAFTQGLNIITGETGAGKSIVMGAVGLILGQRADTNVLHNTDKKCFVEGFFTIDNRLTVQQFLQENELEQDNELVIRREILASGKSRAFINDTPATLQQLRQLASMLVDLHQQFDTLELGDANFQQEVIDALANNGILLKNYQQEYKLLLQLQKKLANVTQQKESFAKEKDYNSFLLNELADLNLQENELENLENELKVLSNTEGIKAALNKVAFGLQEGDEPMVNAIKQYVQQLNAYSHINTNIASTVQRLQSVHVELVDIAAEVESLNDEIVYDEERIQAINDRLNIGYKLQKKHGVQSTAQLLAIQQELEEKLQSVLQIDDVLIQLQQETLVAEKNCLHLAEQLLKAREKQVKPFEEKVNQLLHQVGMPNARIKVQLTSTPLQIQGLNNTEFLFDANKSNKFESIHKVASGGELSRLMLCIKSLVAQKINLPTLIFDEIDSGISGEAAKQVGIIMKEMASDRQILCITHQPQIAGKANAHYFVYKEIKENAINTNIRLLNNDERITTIAKMLSGEKPSAAALESAKEMMN